MFDLLDVTKDPVDKVIVIHTLPSCNLIHVAVFRKTGYVIIYVVCYIKIRYTVSAVSHLSVFATFQTSRSEGTAQ